MVGKINILYDYSYVEIVLISLNVWSFSLRMNRILIFVLIIWQVVFSKALLETIT